MSRKLENGHGEFFAGLVHDLVAQSSTRYPERFDPLIEELGRFIEGQSPSILIPVQDGLQGYYGSTIPQGHAGVLLVDGKNLTEEGHPTVTCIATYFNFRVCGRAARVFMRPAQGKSGRHVDVLDQGYS